ncbi:MAG: chromosome segregation protein SMC [Micromonosporaceae bacterium]|nr:chromosome segregation protein SMC [Micromonosporaceae bacterium]
MLTVPRTAGLDSPSRAQTAPAIPAHALPQRTPAELLKLARRGLLEAAGSPMDGLRYATAHLAALRAAAAVLAGRARPAPGRRGRPTSVWALLAIVAPELAEWAGFFAAGAAKRAAAEAGIPRVVTAREADDLVRDAGRFLVVVESTLQLSGQTLLTGFPTAAFDHSDAERPAS